MSITEFATIVDSMVGTVFELDLSIGGLSFFGTFTQSVVVSIDMGDVDVLPNAVAYCIDTRVCPVHRGRKRRVLPIPYFLSWMIIESTPVEEGELSQPGEEEERVSLLPWNGNNLGSVVTTFKEDSSDDNAKIIATAVAIVVIMFAFVALMVNRNN